MPSTFELQDFYGQVLHLIVVNIPESLDDGIEAQSLVYAIIDEIKVLNLELALIASSIRLQDLLHLLILIKFNVIGQILD